MGEREGDVRWEMRGRDREHGVKAMPSYMLHSSKHRASCHKDDAMRCEDLTPPARGSRGWGRGEDQRGGRRMIDESSLGCGGGVRD